MERIRIDFSGSHMDHLRNVLDTTPGASRDVVRQALPALPTDLLPEPLRRGRHAEPDFDDEFAAELEVGLADDLADDLVPTPDLPDAGVPLRRPGPGETR